jgi:hypothetical protein
MASIQDQINIIKNIIKTKDKGLIINTIKEINPVVLMYYQMIDNTFEYYTDKLYDGCFNFDIDDAIQQFIEFDDVDFIIYIIKEFNFHLNTFQNKENRLKGVKIIEEIIYYYIENNHVNNLSIIFEKCKCFEGSNSFHILDTIYDYCYRNNNFKILEMYLMDPSNNCENDDTDPDEFNHTRCASLMSYGDYVDIIRVLHKYSEKYPAFLNFDFNLVFNAALVFGREKCIQYVLDNSTIDYHYEEEGEGFTKVNGIYPFTDSIMYAIMGKNINCVKIVLDIFKINENNWEHYFKFAAVYGNLEIIQYMITIKPYLVDQIENFYTNILKFALCEGNIEIVKFAINNGATYSTNLNDMLQFVENYNDGRGPEHMAIDEDYTCFYDEKYHHPENIDEKIAECIQFIHNLVN